jgi:hypothetical protein
MLMTNTKIEELRGKLKELNDVVYSVYNDIDGEYDQTSDDNMQFNDINDDYYAVLKSLVNLRSTINRTIKGLVYNDEE